MTGTQQNAPEPFSAEMERDNTERVLGSRRHGMDHGLPPFDEASWNERYRSRESIWSGRPNPQLVAEVEDAAPGTALDVGCGEGGDAIWLAGRGWQVTGIDFATTALQRAAAHADAAQVGDRVRWVHADLLTWVPETRFDLVSAQFMHLPNPEREALVARLATAVAPGGTLLIVGHDFSDVQTSAGRPNLPEMYYTASELASALDADAWEVLAETRPRTAPDPDGAEITVHDTVLRARKRA
ncbi:class I SAM-dependent methyltransferase [Amycolatopsis sp. CA-230715]|uniref:class I SAM-dependent methyltransferase n=1 Tax=Amycolatopsis sp. CA-230715 TaxID=2745196 RepID=UPI001C3299F7|nr:class I SAM-dependent methyltransferase [Amycolatopsis sp. CA-230715]QWF83252.1 Trans-aconitate 2-methyltransferase [Amycolatopsis sp. CA-230715]